MAIPEPMLNQIAGWVREYVVAQRAKYRAAAEPIGSDDKMVLRRFFGELVDTVTIAMVSEAVEDPPFYAGARALGIDPPKFSEMAGVTFIDTIVAVRPYFSRELLFHELVHVVQYRELGVERFARCYVAGFLNGGSYEAIPLEEQAREMEERFSEDHTHHFSVADAVKQWAETGWY